MIERRMNTRLWILAGLWLTMFVIVVVLHEILMPFLLSALFAYLLAPLVSHMSQIKIGRFKLPASVAIISVYLTLALFICLLAIIFLPQLYEQLLKAGKIIADSAQTVNTGLLQVYVQPIENFLGQWGIGIEIIPELVAAIKTKALHLVGGLQELIQQIFNFVFKFMLVLMITGFILVDTGRIKRFAFMLSPSQDKSEFDALLARIDRGLSGVVRGQLTICLVNAVLTFIGLVILDVQFPLVLATVAGIFSLVPVFGSIISTIPIALVALMTSPLTSLLTILWIAGIHVLEANFLNPKIMGSAAKIHPVLIVLALLAGEHFFGLAGALLAVPIASIFLNIFNMLLFKTQLETSSVVAKD